MDTNTNQQPQSPQSVVEQTPVPSKHSVNSKILLVSAALFIVVMLGLIIYILAAKTKPTSQLSTISPTLSQPSPTPDPIANWKTYIDVVNGFSIKYPNNWNEFSVANESGGYLLRFVLTPLSKEPLNEKEADSSPGVHIGVLKMEKCSDSADYAQNEVNTYLKNKELYPNLDIHLLNLTGIHGYRINSGSPGTIAQRGPEVYILNCKIEIQISFDPTGIKNSEQLFDQILSTFQFSN